MSIPPLFATQLVGSWCKPHWLCDHDLVYGKEGSWWRVSSDHLEEAQDDAVRLAVYDQNRAGLSYQTDGEQRRQTFSGHFYGIDGIDIDRGAAPTSFDNDVVGYLKMKERPAPDPDAPPPKFELPRVVSALRWPGPMLVDSARFLKRHAAGLSKVTMIGPCTLALRVVDEHYGSLETLAFALAEVINQELKALDAAGVDLIQLDEPEVHFRYTQLKGFATEAIDRAIRGVETRTAVHMCYGYSKNIAEKRANPVYGSALELLAASAVDDISLEYEQPQHGPELLTHAGDKGVILGVLNLDTEAAVEVPEQIVARAKQALEVIGPEKLKLGPDCGMWFLPRPKACAKITAMERAAAVLRGKHG